MVSQQSFPYRNGYIELFSLGHFDQGGSQCLFWEIITGRVDFRFGNCHACDNIVLDDHSKSLTTVDETLGSRTIVCELHVAGLGEFTVRIGHKFDH